MRKALFSALGDDVNDVVSISRQMTTINSRLIGFESNDSGSGRLISYASDYDTFWIVFFAIS